MTLSPPKSPNSRTYFDALQIDADPLIFFSIDQQEHTFARKITTIRLLRRNLKTAVGNHMQLTDEMMYFMDTLCV